MATIYYHDIGDYLSREQKLKMVHDFRSVKRMDWTKVVPNEKSDWINQRGGEYDSYIILGDKKEKIKAFFSIFSSGDITHRDVWCYDASKEVLAERMRNTIDFYNEEKEKCLGCKSLDEVMKVVSTDDTRIKWDQKLYEHALKGVVEKFEECNIRLACYRPFFKQWLYYDKSFNWSQYQLPKLFSSKSKINSLICVSGIGGSKGFSSLITDCIPDLQTMFNGQCFPLYYYEENTHKQKTLFDDTSDDDYIRHDGITDWILKEVRNRYNGAKNITKEMIFYYVYGLLHSRDYRERFAADLKKSLPRIPIVERIEDFMAFYKAGKQLAELHLNYEEVPPHPEVVVHITAQRADQDDYDYFRVDPKMKFRSKEDKSVILYNANIRLENIPLKAYDYIVNGKSAIEWILERYCVSIDKKSLIKNDANDWAREHGKPRYILDLLLSVINVSTQTVDIVNNLPHLTFD